MCCVLGCLMVRHSPCPVPGQSIFRLWWAKCHWDRFFYERCAVLLSTSCHHCFLCIHLSPQHRITLAIDSVVVEGTVWFRLASLYFCCAFGNKDKLCKVLVPDNSFSSHMPPKITLAVSRLSVCSSLFGLSLIINGFQRVSGDNMLFLW